MRCLFFFIAVMIYPVIADECDICLEDETSNLWLFTCNQLEGGCKIECIYLITSDTSEYIEQSSFHPISLPDDTKCSNVGVRIFLT